jgi:hypothetical protein
MFHLAPSPSSLQFKDLTRTFDLKAANITKNWNGAQHTGKIKWLLKSGPFKLVKGLALGFFFQA